MSPENERFSDKDREFFEGLDDQLEGNYPGIPEVVDRLCFEEFARPIATRDKDPETNEWKEETIGAILPLTKDNSGHLWLFNTGDMLVTEPSSEDRIEDYKQKLSPSKASFAAPDKYIPEVIEYLHDLGNTAYDLKITHSNTSTEDKPKLYEFMDQSIKTATETKAEREQVKRESVEHFKKRLGETIFKKPDRSEPPDEPSPSPPTKE